MLNFLSEKESLISRYKTHSSDSGSVFVQIALLCARIDYLSKHIEKNHKDHSAKRSLLVMIQKRRKLLPGAFNKSKDEYLKIIKDFGLRDSIGKSKKLLK